MTLRVSRRLDRLDLWHMSQVSPGPAGSPREAGQDQRCRLARPSRARRSEAMPR
jgi:hypothetical protein